MLPDFGLDLPKRAERKFSQLWQMEKNKQRGVDASPKALPI